MEVELSFAIDGNWSLGRLVVLVQDEVGQMAALDSASYLRLRQGRMLSGWFGGNDEPYFGREKTSQAALWRIGGGAAFLPTPVEIISGKLIRGVTFVATKVSAFLLNSSHLWIGFGGGKGLRFSWCLWMLEVNRQLVTCVGVHHREWTAQSFVVGGERFGAM